MGDIRREGKLMILCCFLFGQGYDISDAQEGDPQYLAPELLEGKFGKPADIFR